MNNYSTPQIESKYVVDTYNTIASHFSSTRYSQWPNVKSFIDSFTCGCVVGDIGCGNGKYLVNNNNTDAIDNNDIIGVKNTNTDAIDNNDIIGISKKRKIPTKNNKIYIIGTDIIQSLLNICTSRNCEVLLMDNMHLSFRSNSFDGILSIAVLHHFSNRARRIRALEEIFRVLKKGGNNISSGRALIYVWSYESFQSKDNRFRSKGKLEDQKGVQDVYLPWSLPPRFQGPNTSNNETNSNDLNEGSSKDKSTTTSITIDCNRDKTFRRYYHLFKEGELEELISNIPNSFVLQHGFDHENWWVSCTVK